MKKRTLTEHELTPKPENTRDLIIPSNQKVVATVAEGGEVRISQSLQQEKLLTTASRWNQQ